MPNVPHSRPTIGHKEIRAVVKALHGKHLCSGCYVEAFEEAFAGRAGMKYAVAVSSGTAAIHLSLLALGIKAGDEILLPTYVCTALLNAVNYVGAKAVLVDVDYEDGNISFLEASKKISKKTKAVVVPHMFGEPADVWPFLELGIPVIEDCAQSLGARYAGRPVGSFGLISVFSFYGTKMLATGEGGMVASNDRRVIRMVRDLAAYDQRKDYKVRFNYKMSDIQAALGLAQLVKLDRMLAVRRSIARSYDDFLGRFDVDLPAKDLLTEPVFFRYILKIPGRAQKIINAMKELGVNAEKPVFKPLHQYLRQGGFPVADKLMKDSVSLPIYPSLKRDELNKVKKALDKVLR